MIDPNIAAAVPWRHFASFPTKETARAWTLAGTCSVTANSIACGRIVSSFIGIDAAAIGEKGMAKTRKLPDHTGFLQDVVLSHPFDDPRNPAAIEDCLCGQSAILNSSTRTLSAMGVRVTQIAFHQF